MKRIKVADIRRHAEATPDLHVCDVWPHRCSEAHGEWKGDPETRHQKSCCKWCLTLRQLAEKEDRLAKLARKGRQSGGRRKRK